MSEAPRKRAASYRKKEAEEAEDEDEEVEDEDEEEIDAPAAKKKRASPKTTATDKANTGLRHFSMKVCRKVEEKGKTTYNEVADELVKEVFAERDEADAKSKLDEKNIRRRVYDALNVLMAMDIISKDKKDIRWKGLPSNTHHDLDMLQRERQFRRSEVERKRESLRELLVQQVCFRNLVQHNQRREAAPNEEKIPLPFIVVNTHSSAVIQCEMSPDRTDVMFDFSMPFEINDDNTILKRLGMHKTSMTTLQSMLPRDLLQYCQEHGLLDSIVSPEPEAGGAIPPSGIAIAPPVSAAASASYPPTSAAALYLSPDGMPPISEAASFPASHSSEL